ncbi:MAG: phosphatidate cytidylyltransferase, partial [Elusimicrobia bacterium]|nr:phosphatidate cytidylyltransferase [Elusimicrobiota bacterium]
MLLPRLLTTVIGIPLVGMAIYLGGLPFHLLVLGVVGVSLREFYLMAEGGGYPGHGWLGTIGGLAWVVSVAVQGPRWNLPLTSLGSGLVVTLLVVGTVLGECVRRDIEWSFVRVVVTWAGLLYVAWGLSHLLLIRELRPMGVEWTAFLFLLIWAQDIAAYVVGQRFGRHPCTPTLSPHKTWEGTAGGLCAAAATALGCRALFLRGELGVAEAVGLGVG